MGRSKNVDSWISEHDPAIRQISREDSWVDLRDGARGAGVDQVEQPLLPREGRIFYIAATDSYVNLGFFGGAALTDTSGRIEVTVKRMRHVKVRALEDINEAQFAAWIGETVANDERGAR